MTKSLEHWRRYLEECVAWTLVDDPTPTPALTVSLQLTSAEGQQKAREVAAVL